MSLPILILEMFSQAGGDARSQQRGTLNAPPGPEGHSSSENMTNSSEHSQRVSSSEALRSSSSASSLAPQGATDGIRGGPAESSGRGWADLSGDMQQRLSMGQGQQPRRSSDSFASIPRVYSNERIAPGPLNAPWQILVFGLWPARPKRPWALDPLQAEAIELGKWFINSLVRCDMHSSSGDMPK